MVQSNDQWKSQEKWRTNCDYCETDNIGNKKKLEDVFARTKQSDLLVWNLATFVLKVFLTEMSKLFFLKKSLKFEIQQKEILFWI